MTWGQAREQQRNIRRLTRPCICSLSRGVIGAGFSVIVRRAPVVGFRRRYDEGLTKGRPRPLPGGLLAVAAAVVFVAVVVDCRLAPPAAAANGGCGTRPGEGSSCAPGDGARGREDSSSLRCCVGLRVS